MKSGRIRTSLIALLAAVVYATVRYNIFKGVPWGDWPVYVLNKAFAAASLLLVVTSVLRMSRTGVREQADTLRMAGVFAAMHVLFSLMIFSPLYFENFFSNGRLTLSAGASMALGAAAACAMAAGMMSADDRKEERTVRALGIVALVIGLHAALQGFAGWFAPAQWPGFLPPITLISFLLGAAGATVILRKA